MSAVQRDLTGGRAREHLTTVRPSRAPHDLRLRSDRERYCRECGARVTISADGTQEWGHDRGETGGECCPHHVYGGEISTYSEVGR